MRRALLLDTHFVLWLRARPNQLTVQERRLIDEAPLRLVSAASFWEIAILAGLGRVPKDSRWFAPVDGLEILAIEPRHCASLLDLPPVHRDPFDRMLIAQARCDDILLMTRDEKILNYGEAGATCADLA